MLRDTAGLNGGRAHLISGWILPILRGNHSDLANCLYVPHSPWKAGEAGLAGEELLHGGLFEVALLGDELVQRADQRIHIAQRLRDGALFGTFGGTGHL